MVGLRGGITGEGLRSVGVAPTSPNQERVLYPAHRSTFTGRGILRDVLALYHDAMKITPTPHGHRRMHERRVTVADIRNVLNSRSPMHFSPNRRVHTGRALDGRRLEVIYTEAKAGEVRIVSVAAP
jgi:hypothetical protein